LAHVDHRWERQCHSDPFLYQISSNIHWSVAVDSEVFLVVKTLSRLDSAALLQGCLCNAVVCACDDAAMRVLESYSLIHDVANRSHNVAFTCSARTRSSFIGVQTSTSNLRLQPRLTDRRILRPHSTCPVELSLFPLDQRRYSMSNGRLITCRCPS
jgi:hypothetical protein